jgi:hypothetical protein
MHNTCLYTAVTAANSRSRAAPNQADLARRTSPVPPPSVAQEPSAATASIAVPARDSTVTSALPALSAHVVVEDDCFLDGHAPRLLDQLQACLAGHFDVEHSTFQLEAAAHAGHEAGTH